MNNALLPTNPAPPIDGDQGSLWQWANYRAAAILPELETLFAAAGAALGVPATFHDPVHVVATPGFPSGAEFAPPDTEP